MRRLLLRLLHGKPASKDDGYRLNEHRTVSRYFTEDNGLKAEDLTLPEWADNPKALLD